MIASDGGFLEAPVTLTNIRLSPGERAEIVLDFSAQTMGTSLYLQGAGVNLIRFDVESKTANVGALPSTLNVINRLNASDSTRTRQFELNTLNGTRGGMIGMTPMGSAQFAMGSGMSGGGAGMQGMANMFANNGKAMDMNRVDETVKLGATEIWEITTQMAMPHPFHIHDVQFLILDRSGTAPQAYEAGWKDKVLVNPNETVRVISKFSDYTGIYMYHCHILEHEGNGMMGRFEVIP